MQESDAKTLRAALAALAKLDTPLEPETRSQLNQIAQSLGQHSQAAIQRLRDVVSISAQLKDDYEKFRIQLQGEYQTKSRNKVITVRIKGSGSQPETLEAENLSLSLDAIKISQAILGSEAPEQAAKDVKQQVQLQVSPEQTAEPLHPWTRYLQF